MVRGHFQRQNQLSRTGCFVSILQHTQMHELHNNRKVDTALPSSKTLKLTPDILYLMECQTVPQEVKHSGA